MESGTRTEGAERAALRYPLGLLVVALGSAAFAVAFRETLGAVFGSAFGAIDIVSAFQQLPPWSRIALPTAGGLLAGVLTLLAARTGHGQDVGAVMEAVALGRGRLSLRTTLLKSLGSWFAIAGGGSIGREGPLIQFGGSLGAFVAHRLRIDDGRARALIAAGTAAGFAAAYNTPFAAVLFVLEVVTGIAALEVVLGAVTATAIATAVTRAAAGAGPIYGQRSFALASDAELVAYAALGLIAALAAQGFMRLLSAGETLFTRSRVRQPLRAAVGGLCVGLVAVWIPEVTGNGYEPLNAMLDGTFPLGFVVMLLVAKAFATTASVASGSPGGVFTPTLFLGAACGLCFHRALEAVPEMVPLGGPGAYALVGMAAITAATTHAPMMAAVLVFELSGDYAIVVPLLVATAVATTVSHALRADSIYEAELRRRGIAWELTLEGRRVVASGATGVDPKGSGGA